ncbi:hypothetical protein LQV63_15730 [Paenibacillus profundus]|uniref:Uncharacterized protein n=2 Tax=Paenibacillus profundus TaxID=1173085 RepID=A0ABM7GFR9_9BACL|nr:hypothetical protein [Paenibacillus profundus]
MANSVCMPDQAKQRLESLGMSNGLTEVFIDVLALSGSAIARTNREKELVIWIAQRDQSVVGRGTVGFSLDEMPWTVANSEQERQFLLQAIDGAMAETGWERLSYEPNRDIIQSCLAHFRTMVMAMDKDCIDPGQYEEWSAVEEGDDCPTIPVGYPQCAKHRVYLSCHGCVICNYEKGAMA